jgi:hypothetical protein
MTLYSRVLAVVGLLVIGAGLVGNAKAQKVGGVLRIYSPDSREHVAPRRIDGLCCGADDGCIQQSGPV